VAQLVKASSATSDHRRPQVPFLASLSRCTELVSIFFFTNGKHLSYRSGSKSNRARHELRKPRVATPRLAITRIRLYQAIPRWHGPKTVRRIHGEQWFLLLGNGVVAKRSFEEDASVFAGAGRDHRPAMAWA